MACSCALKAVAWEAATLAVDMTMADEADEEEEEEAANEAIAAASGAAV